MKTFSSLLLFSLLITGASAQNRYWIASSPGNWNDTNNWALTSGGAGGATVPGATEVAIFDALGAGNCLLDIAPTVNGLTVNGYVGSVDLQGQNLTTTGTNTLASGSIINSGGAASLILNTTGNTTFSGTLINVDIGGTTGRVFFNGSTFGGNVNITKTTNTADTGTGNNTFNGSLTLNNASTTDIYLGNTNPDVFNGLLTLTTSSTGDIDACRTAAGNQINGGIVLNMTTATGDISFGANNGTSTLAAGQTITIGSCGGVGCADVQLANFTQTGSTAQTLTMGGNTTATLTLGPASVFDGDLNINVPMLIFNSSTFNGTSSFTQTGATSNSRGGNVFEGDCTFNNQGDGDMIFGSNAADAGDTWNGDAVFNDLGGGRIRIGENSAGNVFNGTTALNSSGVSDVANRIQISRFAGASVTFNGATSIVNDGNGSDIHISFDAGSLTTFNGPLTIISNTSAAGEIFVGNLGDVVINGDLELNSTCGDHIQISAGTGTVTFGNGAITIGPSGFAQGQLTFRQFTQTGATAISLDLTGARINLGPASTFNGNVSFTANRLLMNGCTYNGAAFLQKNGATGDDGTGNNVFNGVTEIVNSGTGYLRTANSGPDTFNATLTVSNTGTSRIDLADNSAGTQFNGDVIVNSTNGTGIYIGQTSGTSTLADTRTITVGGLGFSAGDLRLRRFTQTGGTAQSLTLTGTAALRVGPSSQFGGNVTFTSPGMYLDGCTYDGTATIVKNGVVDNNGTGNNIFNGVTSITNSGDGYLRTNGNNTFNGVTTITNSGTDDLLLELTSGSVYNGQVEFINTGSSYVRVAYAGATQFNNNIIVNSTSGTGVYFSENALGSSTLADGFSISVGGTGFSAGTLSLLRFTQLGGTPQSLTLTGTGLLLVGGASQFNGNITFIAPRVLLNGAVYNGTAYLEKNGATNDDGNGGNTFNSTTELVNSGSAYLRTSNTTADIFNGTLTLSNTGSSTIQVAHAAAGNQFNGDIIVNSTFGGGIYFSNAGSGSSTLADTRTITVGGLGFTTGQLRLQRFTQVGTAAQTLLLTSVALLQLGPASTFNGDVDFRAPGILLHGTTYNGNTYLEKTGSSTDLSNGGNIFNGITTLANSGSGPWRSAVTALDSFNGDLTLTNSGASYLSMGDNIAGTVFNGNVILNCTSGVGIYFGDNSPGNATLASGRTITIGGSGFSAGELRFNRFSQLGSTAQSLTLTGTAQLTLGPGGYFGGNVNLVAPRVFLDGTTYDGTAYIEKNGASNDAGAGNNVFNQAVTLVNAGSGYLMTANTGADAFNADVTITNSGSSLIYMAHASAGNQFNGNIVVNSTFGSGIRFCNNAAGTATLANTRTITVGGLGWSFGDLQLARFTQTGGTAQTIILPPLPLSTSTLIVGPASTFNGNVNFQSPRIQLNGATYNGTAYIEKTGANNDNSNGGNVFNQTLTYVNSGTGEFRHAVTGLDTYNSDIVLTNTGSSFISMSRNAAGSVYNGNIQVNCTFGLGIYFGESNGTSTLASGRTITIGPSGFTSGGLWLRYFTQTGATAQSLTLTNATLLRIGPSSQFDGNVTFVSPQILLQGCTFNGTTYIEKNGATTNNSYGNNIFNGTTTLVSSGAGQFRLSDDNSVGNNGDQYNGNVTFVRTGAGAFQPAYNRPNYFRGNVNTNSAASLTFAGGTGECIFTGTNAQTIDVVGGSSPIIRRLTMNKASNDLTLLTDVSVSVTATFTQGVIQTTATDYFSILAGATATGMNDLSYVDGPVRKTGNTAFTFPTGDGGFYRPIAISNPANVAHFFTAQYFRSGQGFGGPPTWDPSFYTVSGCEYWTLDHTSTSSVTVTLSWNEAACQPNDITNPAHLRVARWNGTSWVNHGNGGTTGDNINGTIVTAGTVSSFSPFTLASTTSANPLPVELLFFRATPSGSTVDLHWRTASELNNDHFTIERSSTGIDYEWFARKAATGNTSGPQDYLLSDEDPYTGRSYYRLSQTDIDGTERIVAVASVYIETNDRLFVAYPNPAGRETIYLNQKANITVYNALGDLIIKRDGTKSFDGRELTSGVYFIYNQKGEVARLVIK